jgi:hypothetical protein
MILAHPPNRGSVAGLKKPFATVLFS